MHCFLHNIHKHLEKFRKIWQQLLQQKKIYGNFLCCQNCHFGDTGVKTYEIKWNYIFKLPTKIVWDTNTHSIATLLNKFPIGSFTPLCEFSAIFKHPWSCLGTWIKHDFKNYKQKIHIYFSKSMQFISKLILCLCPIWCIWHFSHTLREFPGNLRRNKNLIFFLFITSIKRKWHFQKKYKYFQHKRQHQNFSHIDWLYKAYKI